VEAHIVGAGIAGFSAARALRKLNYKVTIWEKENLPCVYASSRNAAIMRTYECDPEISKLVKRNYVLLKELGWAGQSMLDQRGLFIRPMEIDYYESSFLKKHPQMTELKSEKKEITLESGINLAGQFIPGNGVIDIHAMQAWFQEELRNTGVAINYNSEVSNIQSADERLTGFGLANGEDVRVNNNDLFVMCGGSWSAQIFKDNNLWAPPLFAHKRHLYFIKGPKPPAADSPVIWDERNDIYFRPEGEGYLATHCDQRETDPDDYNSDELETDRFLSAITSVYPFFKEYYISKYWACLRTFTLDNLPVVGFDPRLSNALWYCGFGGRGMSMALSASEYLENQIASGNLSSDFENPLNPGRFL